jgi:large subunit ribosomal protein L4
MGDLEMKIKVLDLKTLKEGNEEINKNLIADMSGEACIPYVINWQLAKKRSGSAKTKIMSEISGTTRKPFKQKGTGSARQGTKRAVQMRGGRTCFGPLPRDFSYSIPKKVVKKALKFVLRTKIKEGKIVVLDETRSLEVGTNSLNKKLASAGFTGGLVLYKDDEKNKNFLLSLKNIKNYKLLLASAINVYDIMNHEFLLIDREAFENVKEVLQ